MEFNKTENHWSFTLTLPLTFERHSTYQSENCTFAQLSKLIDGQKKSHFSNSLSTFQSSAQTAAHTFPRKTTKVHFSSSAAFCFLCFFKTPGDMHKLTAPEERKWFQGTAACFGSPMALGTTYPATFAKLGMGEGWCLPQTLHLSLNWIQV